MIYKNVQPVRVMHANLPVYTAAPVEPRDQHLDQYTTWFGGMDLPPLTDTQGQSTDNSHFSVTPDHPGSQAAVYQHSDFFGQASGAYAPHHDAFERQQAWTTPPVTTPEPSNSRLATVVRPSLMNSAHTRSTQLQQAQFRMSSVYYEYEKQRRQQRTIPLEIGPLREYVQHVRTNLLPAPKLTPYIACLTVQKTFETTTSNHTCTILKRSTSNDWHIVHLSFRAAWLAVSMTKSFIGGIKIFFGLCLRRGISHEITVVEQGVQRCCWSFAKVVSFERVP